MSQTAFLKENEVSERLGIKIRTLRQWRFRRKGPPYLKFVGGVRYSASDLDAWLATRPTGGEPAVGQEDTTLRARCESALGKAFRDGQLKVTWKEGEPV